MGSLLEAPRPGDPTGSLPARRGAAVQISDQIANFPRQHIATRTPASRRPVANRDHIGAGALSLNFPAAAKRRFASGTSWMSEIKTAPGRCSSPSGSSRRLSCRWNTCADSLTGGSGEDAALRIGEKQFIE